MFSRRSVADGDVGLTALVPLSLSFKKNGIKLNTCSCSEGVYAHCKYLGEESEKEQRRKYKLPPILAAVMNAITF